MLLLSTSLLLLLAAVPAPAQGQTQRPVSLSRSSRFAPFNDFFNFRRQRANDTSRLPFFSRLRQQLPAAGVPGLQTDLFGRNATSLLRGISRRSRQEQYRLRLVGGRNSREGNVEVFVIDWRDGSRGWRSICDIGWTKEHAQAVCRQLGFPGSAVATHDGRFGFRSAGVATSVSHCQVGRRGLQFCIHNGLEFARECGLNDLAGVICGTDTSQPIRDRVQVRLVRGTSTNGDVEVRYGGSGWGPVCADGFDLKDAAVVCRMLGLGAPVRSYISGRDAGKPFIMGGVECPSRATNLAQCRAERGPNVRCQGLNRRDRFNGAAVQCAADLPDLEIDAKEVEKSSYVEELTVDELECARDENCLSSSARNASARDTRVLFRFTNKVENKGTRDFRPRLRPSEWVWHSCHGHYHSSESFSDYDLTAPGTNRKIAEGHKASFCLEDSECSTGIRQRYQCVQPERGARPPQGIRAGCSDIYSANIDCQWLDVTDVPSGSYQLKIRVNADRTVPEISFANNMVVCDVRLTKRRRNRRGAHRVRVTNCRVAAL